MPLEKMSEYFRGKKDLVGDDTSQGNQPGVTDQMPVVPHKVLYTGLPIYEDANCTKQIQDGAITILRPLDPDGFSILDVVPSLKEYEVGQYLSWQLNKERLWEECYYRDPDTGQPTRAWTMHVEFVGSVVSDKALEADAERLAELEAKYTSDQPETIN